MLQAYEKVWLKSTLIIYVYTPKYVATKSMLFNQIKDTYLTKPLCYVPFLLTFF